MEIISNPPSCLTILNMWISPSVTKWQEKKKNREWKSARFPILQVLPFYLTGNHPKNFGGSHFLGSNCGQVAKRVGKSWVGNGDLLS